MLGLSVLEKEIQFVNFFPLIFFFDLLNFFSVLLFERFAFRRSFENHWSDEPCDW